MSRLENFDTTFTRAAQRRAAKLIHAVCLLLAMALLALAQAGMVRAQDAQGSPRPESDPEGAVLCFWRIYVAVDAIGKLCPGQGYAAYEPLMGEVIGKMDQFIIANSPTTQAELDAEKSRQFIEARKTMTTPIAELCRRTKAPSELNFYSGFLNWIDEIRPDAVRSQIIHLLAHPRKPLMNPCI